MSEDYENRKSAGNIAKVFAKKLHAEKGVVKLLFLCQILAFAGILITGRTLARDLAYSRYQPDYALYAAKFIVCAAAIVIIGILKRKLRKLSRLAADIHVEPVQDSAAYINGSFLILERDTDTGRKQMAFELDRIRRVRSGGGITAFMYNDPSQGLIEFSTKDDYEPGIAVLLRARGIGAK